MKRWITVICVLAIVASSTADARRGRGTAAALGFIGGMAIGSMMNRPAPPPRTTVVYAAPAYEAPPMEQVFRTQSGFIRRQLQARLQEKGFYYSYVDGAWGPGTQGAFENYASSTGNTQLLTSHAGANELMRMLLSPEEAQQFSDLREPPPANSAAADVADNAASDPAIEQKKLKIANDQLALLNEVLRVETTQGGSGDFHKDKVDALEARIDILEEFKGQSASNTGAKSDSTTMPVAQSGQKVAGIYPLIPYSSPGSGQVGELEVAPQATDKGMVYNFKFVQHIAGSNDSVNTISINSADLAQLNYGLQKSHEWSAEAKKKGLRQLYQKDASCFPEDMCDDDDSDTPTKVLFMLYEDGSTAAKIQQKSGNNTFGYNLSMDSALLLASYLDYMKAKGETEYGVGTMTNADLNSVFK